MLKKTANKKTAVLAAALMTMTGFYSCAYAEQPAAENTSQASEIEMLKQRLNAQERVINNLIRFNDPFAAFHQAPGDLFISIPEPGIDFAGAALPAKSDVFGRMNVSDQKDKIEVAIELPGMDKNNINIEVKDHLLTVTGEKKEAQEVKEGDYYMQERQFGMFNRSVKLPQNVDINKISSRLENGVLTILIPKTDEKPLEVKKIPVK